MDLLSSQALKNESARSPSPMIKAKRLAGALISFFRDGTPFTIGDLKYISNMEIKNTKCTKKHMSNIHL